MYVQGCLKREQDHVKRLLSEKDNKSSQDKNTCLEHNAGDILQKEIQKTKPVRISTTTLSKPVSLPFEDIKKSRDFSKTGNGGSTTSLDRHRPGAARLHGSFRQYKKDRETNKRLLQQKQSLPDSSGDRFVLEASILKKENVKESAVYRWDKQDLSSSSTNSSPTTLPRQQVVIRPNHHPPLRQTRSCSNSTDVHLSLDPKHVISNDDPQPVRSLSPGIVKLEVSSKGTYNSSTFPRKGILKATSSYNGHSPVTISMNNTNNTILESVGQNKNTFDDKRNDLNARSIFESLRKEELNDKLVINTEPPSVINEATKKSGHNISIHTSKCETVSKGEKSDSGRESDECPSSSTTDNSTSDDGLSWQSLTLCESSPTTSISHSVDPKDTPLKSMNESVNTPRGRYKHRSSLTSSCSSTNSSFDATYDSGLSISHSLSSSDLDAAMSEFSKTSTPISNKGNKLTTKPALETPKINAFKRDNTTNSNNVLNSLRKKKPMPPPRSSMTRLTTTGNKVAKSHIPAVENETHTVNDGVRQKPIILPETDLIKQKLNEINLPNTPKILSPPDPLRVLKRPSVPVKGPQEVKKVEEKENKTNAEEKPFQNSKCEKSSSMPVEVKTASTPLEESVNANSNVIQGEAKVLVSPISNANNKKESSEGPKIVPKSILHTISHDDAAQALDLLIHTNTINEFNLSSRKSSKRVKFHPEVKLSKGKEIAFDKEIKNKTSTEKDKNDGKVESKNPENDRNNTIDAQKKYTNITKNKGDISYYEPYV